MLATNIWEMTVTSTSRTARTRALLQVAAMRLFSEQGYDATAVEQIAREAGVSHMTFFRHFATNGVDLERAFFAMVHAADEAARKTRTRPPTGSQHESSPGSLIFRERVPHTRWADRADAAIDTAARPQWLSRQLISHPSDAAGVRPVVDALLVLLPGRRQALLLSPRSVMDPN